MTKLTPAQLRALRAVAAGEVFAVRWHVQTPERPDAIPAVRTASLVKDGLVAWGKDVANIFGIRFRAHLTPTGRAALEAAKETT